jgi:hypothetical protein
VLVTDFFPIKQPGDERLQAGCTKVDLAPPVDTLHSSKKRPSVRNGTDPGAAVLGLPFGDGQSRREVDRHADDLDDRADAFECDNLLARV